MVTSREEIAFFCYKHVLTAKEKSSKNTLFNREVRSPAVLVEHVVVVVLVVVVLVVLCPLRKSCKFLVENFWHNLFGCTIYYQQCIYIILRICCKLIANFIAIQAVFFARWL